jgi:anti-sigma B factor antagonist
MEGTMEFRTERIESALILHLDGRMSAEEDSRWMRRALKEMTDSGVRHALLDLGGVRQLDCSGIGQLLKLREQAHVARRTFGLIDVERRQKRMLELSGLVHVFRMFGDCEAAISALGIEPESPPTKPRRPEAPLRGLLTVRWGTVSGWLELRSVS